MFSSSADAGEGSRLACDGKSAGDDCVKPKCKPPASKAYCATEKMTCKDCEGVLYCKRPLGICTGNE